MEVEIGNKESNIEKISSKPLIETIDINLEGTSLQICWILDITGSMGGQLEACKLAIENTAKKVNEENLPVSFTIITYTEEYNHSYSSYDAFTEADDAVKFIKNVKLCHPPGTIVTNASGGDGDENVKLALARFNQKHNFSVPSVVFFLTDASYHSLKSNKSREAIAEETELKKMNYPIDLFEIWSLIPHSEIFFFPMLFSNSSSAYAQLAQQTGGIMTNCVKRDHATISDAMVKIIFNIIDMLTGENSDPITELPGFEVHNISSINILEKETDVQHGNVLIAKHDEAKEILATSLTKIINVVGKGWNKRKVNLNAMALYYQMKLVAVSVKALTKNADYEELKREIEGIIIKIKEFLPEDQQKTFSFKISLLDELKNIIDNEKVEDEAFDLITLSNAEEIAEEANFEAVKKDFVGFICSVLYGLPVNIVFQLDKLGRIDFTSAWDGVIPRIGIDLLSVKTFLELVNNNDGSKQIGLQDGKEYNSFVILSGKRNTVRWAIFKLASSTQIINSAMSLGVGAKITEFIPNLHAGILSTILIKLIETGYNESLFCRVIDVLNTIEALEKTPAADLQDNFEKGYANPADPIGKMILVWYKKFKNNDELLIKIIKEYLGSRVQKYFGKSTPENDLAYNKYINELFDLNNCLGKFSEDDFEFHPLELAEINVQLVEKFLRKENLSEFKENELVSITKVVNQIREVIGNEDIKKKIVTENKFFANFIPDASRLWTYLHTDISNNNEALPNLVSILERYGNITEDFIEAIILKKRSERFDSIAHEDKNNKSIVHVPKEKYPCIEVFFLELLQNYNSEIIKKRNSNRVFKVKDILIKNVVEELIKGNNTGSNLTQEFWTEFLNKNEKQLNGKTHKLDRKDLAIMPDLYEDKINNKNLIKVIILGKWTSEVPQTLRAFLITITKNLNLLNDPELIESVMKSVNARAVASREKANRCGHSINFQYPGAYLFTQEYYENCKNKKNAENMKNFTEKYNYYMKDDRLDKHFIQIAADYFYYAPERVHHFEAIVKTFHKELFEENCNLIIGGKKDILKVKRGRYTRLIKKYKK
jgi:hypothetical protein